MQKHLDSEAAEAYRNLENHVNVRFNYVKLVKPLYAMTTTFNRKRVGDVMHLTISTYTKEQLALGTEEFELTDLEKILSNNFKRVVHCGKGTKPVPILFSKRLQKYIFMLLDIRKSHQLVPETNDYLFTTANSNQLVNCSSVLHHLS